jgi:A/G-specific adenine glycosylase
MLVLRDAGGRIWLQRRPARGIWAGLHCVPVFASRAELMAALNEHVSHVAPQELAPFVHVLTHRDLHLHPVLACLDERQSPRGACAAMGGAGAWFTVQQSSALGLPAPVRRLLDGLA